MKKLYAALLLVTGLAGAGPLLGQTTNEHAGHHPAPANQATASDLSEGEIRKVDKEAGKLTIKHGPISNLDMPGMTMVFQVRDRTLLEKVQTGDKVRFRAEAEKGRYVVTAIQPVN